MAPVWSCKMRLVCSSFQKVYNSDQTRLQLELRAGRTLATKGVKKVEVVVQRKNALTHSLTVISSAGQLQLPLFVCFQEWKAPQCFNRELQEFTHLRCEHSKSGLMTSELTKSRRHGSRKFSSRMKSDPACRLLARLQKGPRRIWWAGEDRLPDHSANDDRTTPTPRCLLQPTAEGVSSTTNGAFSAA
ncbi:hypothetical protein L596_000829 [Steinernema carpocapsae]|uniref:Uncharacterized protein n=1 Tax=Steinernema carpocapsae TaxID=34508 RepID=A0A4U8UJW2_STECR|nr:hypothetical protein L596_000829 [Steinernema carpocapsae]